ncbi:hypothetical protein CNYM01_06045 [Colletotrichum nymphaeae SA-01]|uniref:Uncharacterized protein n=1 Tax=Colletotrichum nymphaeae SA-01 TaxID=1460502 RepID=A0A135T3L5_9PEZI|nr:hypothetical protein CNYM01_06045 [Colletotrichum nymphaeae SA-01]
MGIRPRVFAVGHISSPLGAGPGRPSRRRGTGHGVSAGLGSGPIRRLDSLGGGGQAHGPDLVLLMWLGDYLPLSVTFVKRMAPMKTVPIRAHSSSFADPFCGCDNDFYQPRVWLSLPARLYFGSFGGVGNQAVDSQLPTNQASKINGA